MSTYVVVEISPETTTRPVLTSVSHATRPFGSSRSTASSTPSEIWSAILSGWPSVTDSEVKRYSLSFISVMSRNRLAGALLALGEVDDQRDALERVALAQPVLDEVRVVARDAVAVVDVDREARRAPCRSAPCRASSAGGPAWPAAGAAAATSARKRLSSGVGMRWRGALAERERLVQQPLARCGRSVADAVSTFGRSRSLRFTRARSGSRSAGPTPSPGPSGSPSPPVRSHLLSTSAVAQPALHRELGDPQVLRGHAVLGVADDERDVGALGRPLGAQRRVVLDRLRDLGGAADAGRVDEHHPAAVDLDRVSIASRVVPATRQTITRSQPRNALTSDDLPTFGRPITARRTTSSSSSGSSSPGRELDDRGRAGRPCRGPGRRTPAAARRGRGRGTRARAAGRSASRSCWPRRPPAARPRRRMSAISSSPGRRPARASTTSSATSASASAARAWSWIETASGSSSLEVDAAGVDQREAPPVPLGRELLAVARDARALVDDRLARLREAVDERRLADVGIADDRDLHRRDSPRRSTTSVAIRSTTSSSVRPVVSTRDRVGRRRERRVLARARRARRARSARPAPARSRAPSSSARRRARSSGDGGEEDLDLGVRARRPCRCRAPRPPSRRRASSACCLATSAARTPGSAATRDAASATSGVRIASVTSRPSSSTRPPSSMSSRSATAAGVAALAAASATRGTSPPCRGT